jgi:NAD(P)-dependent dehydrogenase (short-subunit alcohol dehydrogenase family)
MSIDTTPARRVAIVVGAGGELGLATAVKLSERSMTVVGVDRNEQGLEQLPDGIFRELVDGTDPGAAAPMVERIVRDIGAPATLVNTIGAFQTGDATRILDLELRLLGIRVNCMAPQLLDTAFARTSFPKEVLAHAVSPAAVAEFVAFLVSDAAAPISGAVLPAYGF